MKRAFDIVFSGLGLFLALPIGLVVVLILRFSGEGEVFFRQDRKGRRGRTFGLLKFATMLKDSPNIGSRTITQRDDPRVLPVGSFLRKTKLNEVPQLWNIFVGDMSVVGPRPLSDEGRGYMPQEALDGTVHLRPGLTGIGSIIFRDEEALMHESEQDPHVFYRLEIAPFKGELELWYKRNSSLGLDCKIIFVTAWVVMFPSSRIAARAFPGLPEHPLFRPSVGE